MGATKILVSAVVGAIAAPVHAQPIEPSPPPAPVPEPAVIHPVGNESRSSLIQLHGFLSEGAFLSTANDFIGRSSRGSLELFEAALNISAELTDKLHAGAQLFSQHQGIANDISVRLDWAFLDYHHERWLGLRAGRVRIPFGLYNDYIDIDAARLQVLLPQSIYPVTDRNILTAQTGFAIYGTIESERLGALDYQLYSGVLSVPLPASQDANNTRIYQYDSRYNVGGQVFWHPPIDGIRIGASYLRTSIDYYLNLAPPLTESLIMSGVVPAGFNGNLTLSIRPANLWVASAEYSHNEWLFAAEYSRWILHSTSSPVNLLPVSTNDSERFYGLATYRWSNKLDTGVYYSVLHADADDRGGTNTMTFTRPFYAWSRDAAATIRYDVNDYWLWKLEAHFIDGAAAIDRTLDATPSRFWGLFLVRTTVTF